MNSPQEISIKLASANNEIEDARGIINQAFFSRQKVSRKDCDTLSIEEVHQIQSNSNKSLFIITNENTNAVIGAGLVTIEQENSCGIIQYLAVAQEYSGMKLGKRLLRHLEDFILKASCKWSCLSIIHHPLEPQDRLAEWYKAQGYVFYDIYLIPDDDKAKWFGPKYLSEITSHCYKKELIPSIFSHQSEPLITAELPYAAS